MPQTRPLELDTTYRGLIRSFAEQMREQGHVALCRTCGDITQMLDAAIIFDCREVSCSQVHKTSPAATRVHKKFDSMPHLPVPDRSHYFEFADGFHVLAIESPETYEEWQQLMKEAGLSPPPEGEDIFIKGERIVFFPIGMQLVFGVPGSIGKGAIVRHELQGVRAPPDSAVAPTCLAIERAAARLIGLLSLLTDGSLTTETLADRRVLRMASH